MSSLSNSHLYSTISHDMKSIIDECTAFVNDIWCDNKLIPYFTDHGLSHSIRIIKTIEKFPFVVNNGYLSENEAFVLLLGSLLHDIGMQCDLRKFPTVREYIIREYSATFTCDDYNNGVALSSEHQNDIRANHHLISSAWILHAYTDVEKNDLWNAIHKIPPELMPCLAAVCRFHSKLDIRGCDVISKTMPGFRTQLIASLVRLGDELDIGSDRINNMVLSNFDIPKNSAVFWYIHRNTKVSITDQSIVRIDFHVVKNDRLHCSEYLISEHNHLVEKNKIVIDILRQNGIVIFFNDSIESIIENEYINPLPQCVRDYFVIKYSKELDIETTMRYLQKEAIKALINKLNSALDDLSEDFYEQYVDKLKSLRENIVSMMKIICDEIDLSAMVVYTKNIASLISNPNEYGDICALYPSVYGRLQETDESLATILRIENNEWSNFPNESQTGRMWYKTDTNKQFPVAFSIIFDTNNALVLENEEKIKELLGVLGSFISTMGADILLSFSVNRMKINNMHTRHELGQKAVGMRALLERMRHDHFSLTGKKQSYDNMDAFFKKCMYFYDDVSSFIDGVSMLFLSARYVDKIPIPEKRMFHPFKDILFRWKAVFEKECHHKGIVITFPKQMNPTDDKRSFMWADPYQIEQVAYNLIVNAIKYSLPNTQIAIDCYICKDGKKYLLEISNFSVPIPTDEVKMIFEYYKKGSNAKHTTGEGSGLYISRTIAHMHGGDLKLTQREISNYSIPLIPAYKAMDCKYKDESTEESLDAEWNRLETEGVLHEIIGIGEGSYYKISPLRITNTIRQPISKITFTLELPLNDGKGGQL